MEPSQGGLTAPYVPFKTFLNALDHLRAIGVPHKIDREVFPSFSGINQGQVLGALRFLGLIDDAGVPHGDLTALTESDDKRKLALREVLKKRYSKLVSLGLEKVSPSQFDKALSDYGVAGATHQKAKSFFLKAAQFAELPLSPLLMRTTRNTSSRRRRLTQAKQVPIDQSAAGVELHEPSRHSRIVKLNSGGEVRLSYTVSLFDLVGQDREFVFGLIDQIQKYEKRARTEPVSE